MASAGVTCPSGQGRSGRWLRWVGLFDNPVDRVRGRMWTLEGSRRVAVGVALHPVGCGRGGGGYTNRQRVSSGAQARLAALCDQSVFLNPFVEDRTRPSSSDGGPGPSISKGLIL